MEFLTEDWDIFMAAEFETAASRMPSELSIEVMAQDHWRAATGKTYILDATVHLATLIPVASVMPQCKLTYQSWLAELGIRCNMTSSQWLDKMALLGANKLTAANSNGQPVEYRTVVENLQALLNRSVISAVIRWTVCASKDGKLEIQLQCLPGAITSMSCKPIFKRLC